VRPTERATVSAPLAWSEIDTSEPGDFTLLSMPGRFAKLGDLHSGMDRSAGSLDALLALYESQGLGDAPWPPHYRKQRGEPPRVQPSKAKRESAAPKRRGAAAPKRGPRRPLIEVGRAKREQDALAGLERWKKRHREAVAYLEEADVLVDAMRGRYSTWTRVRLNLEHVPPQLRPRQEALDPDENTSASS
ncbi:MAG TPA: DNA primase, partial [Gammaproteobacteria bacterium]|nr:DNA primase [Gammaproteobacteria bacterium]